MGALAPISLWIPEDDLLLKNAVEAGASLESLAKGAVQFSRKFTVRELQDRWLTLLYDPIISAEASAQMIEFERSVSMLPSKFNRFGNLKENKCATGKRKVESVRSCYYALRKRVCNEPFNSMDLTFLVGPTNNTYVGNGDEPLSANCMLGDAVSNPFGLEVSEMDNMTCAFPNALMDGDDGTIHSFHTGLRNPAEENFSTEQTNMHEELSHVLGESMPSTRNVSEVGEMGEPTDLASSLFEGVEIEVKTSPTFNQVDGDQLNMCPEFEGNKVFDSPVSVSVTPFNMEYLSPLPGMPIWKTVSTSALPVDNCLGDRDLCCGDSFHFPDDYDARSTRTSGFDVHSEVKVKMETETAYDNFQVHNGTENYLAELSNSLLNFNDEELLCMHTDGRDMIDKSYYDGLSSLLLSSPNDVGQDQMTNITELEISIAPDICPTYSSGPCRGELHDDTKSHNGEEQISFSSPSQMQSSISASNLQYPELDDGVICCMLNTEDPEVPCNDNVFISNQPAVMLFTAEAKLQETNRPLFSSVKDFSSNHQTSDRQPNLMHKERKTPGGSHAFSHVMGSQVSQEMGPNLSVCGFGVKLAASKSDLANMASKVTGIASTGLNSANSSTRTLQETLKEETREMLMAKHLNSTDVSIEKPASGCVSFKSYPHANAIGIKEEHDGFRDQESIHAELTPMNTTVFEPLLDNSTAEQDGVLHESEDDIPCYSDIEAMVLDMDLDPDEQDLHFSEEVSRYQHEETKRAIIRLEQSAHSYMQRNIRVLLGRATFESPVDIDLGREGRSNKISRRQVRYSLVVPTFESPDDSVNSESARTNSNGIKNRKKDKVQCDEQTGTGNVVLDMIVQMMKIKYQFLMRRQLMFAFCVFWPSVEMNLRRVKRHLISSSQFIKAIYNQLKFRLQKDNADSSGAILGTSALIDDFDAHDLRVRLPAILSKLYQAVNQNGGVTYIHCTAGMGRAPATAIIMVQIRSNTNAQRFGETRQIKKANSETIREISI